MKILLRAAKEAAKYKWLLIASALSTLGLTGINLLAPKILSKMTGIVSEGVDQEKLKTILYLALTLCVIYLLRVFLRFCSSYLSHKAAWWLVQDIRMRVYDKIQSFSLGFFHNKPTGELMSRVLNDTSNFEQLYAHIMPESVTNFATLIGVTVILFTINPRLALLTCVPIPLILFSGWILVKKVRPLFRIMQKTLAVLNSKLQENFSGMHEIQAFYQQDVEHDRVLDKSERDIVNRLRALKISGLFHPSVEFLTSMGTIIVVGFGGYLAYLNQLSVEDVVAFLLYLSLFYAPVTGLAVLLENSQTALAGAERVMEIMDTPVQITEKADAMHLQNVQGELAFEHVSFHYEPTTPVLKDVSFTVKPGQMVALVGPTGVGKSTVIQLLDRFYDPVEGRVTLDSHDLKDITIESLRHSISMVLQDTFLFNETIGDNIRYANPNITDEEMIAAAKAARIHEDIMNMPNGYDTLVGERGTKLSGGQKQRIAIARAILHNAPVLILDEATASVDVETEAQIQQAIQDLAGTRTIIAIAHRLSTVRRADVILVFEEGRIVQRGTHDELVRQEGLYRRMCTVQAQGEYMNMGDLN